MTANINRRIVLNSRPVGAPKTDNFRMEEGIIPTPATGQMLLRNLYLSLDPYMRGRMSDAPSYAPPVAMDDVMIGSTISYVEESQHPDYQRGDTVLSYAGWQDYALSNGMGLIKLNASNAHLALGVLGMPGFTAYMGLLDIGKPKSGETVVVAAASGAVGSIVGQIAKLQGCRVVGIAGTTEKCRFVVDELGFDACINHHSEDLTSQLALTCPNGIDVYFENVGGAVFTAVLPLLNTHARIPLCGLIAHYNETTLPLGPDHLSLLTRTLLVKRIKMQGFIIFDDYGHRYDEFYNQMSLWLKDGKIKHREDIIDGLAQAPEAFMGLLEGKNFGKLIIRLTNESKQTSI